MCVIRGMHFPVLFVALPVDVGISASPILRSIEFACFVYFDVHGYVFSTLRMFVSGSVWLRVSVAMI